MKYRMLCLILFLLVLISIPLSTLIGSSNISINKVIDIYRYHSYLFRVPIDDMGLNSIVWDIRLPRAIIAILVGGGLALSGCVMQALTGNVMAEPYTLGVQSGAGMFAAFSIAFLDKIPILSFLGTNVLAFIGAMLSTILVYIISSKDKIKSSTTIILTGISISMLCNAIIQLIIAFAPNNSKIRGIIFWMMGGLGGVHWDDIPFLLIVSIVGFSIIYILSEHLNILSMGEETAIILGINLDRLNKILLITVSIMVGAIVSVSGTIGFVGLIIPHIVRKLNGANHKILIPLSTLIGSIFLLWMDVISRIIVAPRELPIGVLTSLVGVPFFLLIIRKRMRG